MLLHSTAICGIGLVPLLIAAQNDHISVVKALLNKGADPNEGAMCNYKTLARKMTCSVHCLAWENVVGRLFI